MHTWWILVITCGNGVGISLPFSEIDLVFIFTSTMCISIIVSVDFELFRLRNVPDKSVWVGPPRCLKRRALSGISLHVGYVWSIGEKDEKRREAVAVRFSVL